MRERHRTAVLIAMGLLWIVDTGASSAAAPTTPCSGSQFREFDFWIGDWQVESNGKVIADNSINLAQNGCVLHERYRHRRSGYSGQSLNMYDATRAVWHQSWVDNAGTLLLLDGGMKDGEMVLEGKRLVRDQDGWVDQWERITWTANANGSVRQHWQSRKKGEAWKTEFDGIYSKLNQGSADSK